MFSLYNVRYILNVGCISLIVRHNRGRVPPIPATKGLATEKFEFLVFLNFKFLFFEKIFLGIFRISLMTTLICVVFVLLLLCRNNLYP